MDITFNFLSPVSLTQRQKLKTFILLLIKKEKRSLNYLNVIFCSDAYLLKINKEYLFHNYFTDIITFSYAKEKSVVIEGDIYISVDTVRKNAARFNNTINHEMHRVIFHGALHLCGFKDKNLRDQAIMTAKENEYLDMYFAKLATN